MWLTCRFLLRNFTWEERLEFFAKSDEDFLENYMSKYLLQNFEKYAGVIIRDETDILCAIVQ